MQRLTVFVVLAAVLLLAGAGNAQAVNLTSPCSSASVINVSSSWYCKNVYPSMLSTWSKWSGFAAVAILFSFSLATVIFIFGIVLRNDRVRTFGVGELYEALATLLIVALFLFVSGVIFGLVPGLFVPINPYNTTLTLINSTIGGTSGIISNLFIAQMVPAYYATFSITICGPGGPPGSGLPICTEIPQVWAAPLMVLFALPATAITLLLMDGLLVLTAEFYVILFFMFAALPVFLIPGVIFRAILPTRSFGGMLIAMAIGFYMIMPLMFAISYELNTPSAMSQLVQYGNQIAAQSGGSNAETNALTPQSPLILDLNGISGSMSQFWLMILFYPALIMAVTYGSIITIAEFIGGMSSTSGRLRAIL